MGSSKAKWLGAIVGLIAAALLTFGAPRAPAKAQEGSVVVFAAASLKNALDAVNTQWRKETGKKARISYAATSALARQIEAGAPAQVFLSADLRWMDYLAAKSLIKPQTRANLLGNRIVLIAPKDKAAPIEIKPGFDLAKLLGDGRLAMANVEAVPAGRYAKAALEKLRCGRACRQAGAGRECAGGPAAGLPRRGAARHRLPDGRRGRPRRRIVGVFPESTHPRIIYPVALTADATHPDAAAFLAYIRSAKAKPLFEAQGFTFLNDVRS